MAPVRDGNASVRKRRDGRTDARHDLECDARFAQRLRFFAAATEDERIAALESHDAHAFARFSDCERFDIRLRHRMRAAALTDEDALPEW